MLNDRREIIIGYVGLTVFHIAYVWDILTSPIKIKLCEAIFIYLFYSQGGR